MTIREIVRQGFHYARTCKSLWVFGFVVGLASAGSGGGSNSGGGGGSAAAAAAAAGAISSEASRVLPVPAIALIAMAFILIITLAFIVRFVSEGALIEGVVRARQGGTMTTGEGFRAGWAHWGVLLRIAIVYVGATILSLGLLVVPCVLAVRAFGLAGGLALGIPALIVAVPWLVTLYLVQAFASRIAVLEHRHAMDAIAKARLFLHGRLRHSLRLIVATLLGSLMFTIATIVTVVPVVLGLVALGAFVHLAPAIVLGALILLPLTFVIAAMFGTFRSSVWTIGYLNQVEL